jgi:two-component system copper resistance phosphate regulon response regulator CusR
VKVLIVEDDAELCRVLTQGFAEQDVRASCAHTYGDGRARATQGSYDVIVLDVMLPGGDGFALCADIRKRGVATPILMLTARDAVSDRVRGLEAGADDYLVKPFAFTELLARTRALARRPPGLASRVVRVADLEVDLAAHRVARNGAPIELTAKEFALLELFVTHRGRVVDRAAITAHVWDENHDPFTNVLEVLVGRLRRKIDDGFEPKLIHTLRGSGYRFGAAG